MNTLCQRRVIDAGIASVVVAADGGANRILDMGTSGDQESVSNAVTVADT